MLLPFIHPGLLVLGVVTAVAVGLCWGKRPRRSLATAGITLGVLAAAVLGGFLPLFGQITVAAHGVLMALGFAGAWLMVEPRAIQVGADRRHLVDFFIIAIVGGLAGARLRFVQEHWDEVVHPGGAQLPWSEALMRAVDIDRGGMVWYGGLIVAAALCVAYAQWRHLPKLPLSDAFMPGLVLGLGIGRIGCHLNGCCYGAPTTLPWGIGCAHFPGQMVHPTQLYEAGVCLVLAGGLWWWWRHRRWDGQITLATVMAYGAWRFLNEALRGDTVPSGIWGGLITTSQATSVHLMVAALIVAVVIRARRRRDPALAAAARQVPGSSHAAAPRSPPEA